MAKTLLVADDSATMRRVVEMTFAGEDVQVVTAPSGEAALQKAKDVKPDVILADAQMGSMSGYDLCRAVKGDAGLRGTSVIVMASQHAPYDEALGRDVGADDHCVKPFDTQALIDKVKAAVARGATVKMAAAPPPGAAPVPAGAAVLTPPPAAAPPAAAGAPRASGAPTLKTPAAPPPPAPPAPPPRPVAAAAPPAPPVTVTHSAPPPPAPPPAAAHEPAAALVAEATDNALAQTMGKAAGLGLTAEQAAAITKLTREVVERVVWEVVPDLAETIIKEEIRRLTRA